MDKLDIRTYTWLNDSTNLSWVYVMKELIGAFDRLGHNTYVVSTNGMNDTTFPREKMLKSVLELQKFGLGKRAVDVDLCYTVPLNFGSRFLPNSKAKAAIYNYETFSETGGWPSNWKQFYGLASHYFPSSNFSAEIFCLNGVPEEKVFVIPHGVNTELINPNVSALKLPTEKRFKFCSITAPHVRKNIPLLLEAFCEAFTAQDDVCLILKSKIYKKEDGIMSTKNPNGRLEHEIILYDILTDLDKKYGTNKPEIITISERVENVASIYNACNVNVSATGAEGWGMPFAESQACGLLNIVPSYSGQLDFMNEKNSLLVKTSIRNVKHGEQYWTWDPKSKIGQVDKKHLIECLRRSYFEYDTLLAQFKPEMERQTKLLSWENAAQKIIDAVNGKLSNYKKGTYKLP
jgi:glycosyltransferase involved in cell wall biosynthesis